MASSLNAREEGSQRRRSSEDRKEVQGGEKTDWEGGGISSLNPVSTRVQRLQNRAYSTDSLTGQRTVCAGSLHYQHQPDVITTVIHLSKQYQPGVCKNPYSFSRMNHLHYKPAVLSFFFLLR